MFSANNKISVRQTKYLLLLDWIARLVILLPICLSGKTVGSAVFCVLTGTAVWWLISDVILRWMKHETDAAAETSGTAGHNILTEIKFTMGTGTTVIFCFAGLLFFLVQAAVFLNLTGELCAVYLLPELPVQLICLLPVIAAVMLSMGSIEVPGRFGEVTGPIVMTLLVLLIFLAAFGMELHPQEETLVSLADHLEMGSFEVFACLGGLFLPVLRAHMAGNISLHTVKKSGLAAALAAGSLCVVVIGSYGRNGMQYVEFPVVRVMSNLRLPGGFLQRWDILFLGLMLVCLTVTVAVSLWYVKALIEALWGLTDCTWENRVTLSWSVCVLLVYLAAAGFLSAWSAISYYRALNLQVLTPLLFFFYIIMSAQRMKKVSVRFSRGLALLLLAAVSIFLLTGCTAYEPEERLFPMALEVRVEDEELVVAYAWDEGTGPGSVSGAGSEESESANGGAPSEETSESLKADPSGESGKYAKSRDGITIFRGKSLGEIQEKVAAFSERYMDYSHVKAVLVDASLQEAPDMERAVVEWMAGEPAFATGLIIYQIQEDELALEQVQEQAGGQVGKYLENLYNNNEAYRAQSTTLGKLIAEYYA